jgi:kumamolisin
MSGSDSNPAGASPAGMHSYVHFARRPDRRPYFKLGPSGLAPRAAGAGPWNVPDLCAAYNWPTGLAGGGVIAIVELGGGWLQSDMNQFFRGIGQPLPQIADVPVSGKQNSPGDPNADGEVALDIQVAAAAYYVATGKPAVIRVYWAPDIAPAVRAATADRCDVCSISWGADEAKWGRQAADEMEQAAAAATAAGMIVFAASGDNDSSDGGPNPANVDLPASAPHVIGCGGTKKTATSESVWNNAPGNPNGNGTGGGYSTLFTPLPPWQAGAPNGPGRMVPDVAANADPNTGYNIVLNGATTPIGGTSAVAPLYAGLFAAFGRKLGWITPELWLNHTCFNDITEGDNGAFRARTGPDPCTGIGSPIGDRLARLLTNALVSDTRRLKDLEAENARLRQTIAELHSH